MSLCPKCLTQTNVIDNDTVINRDDNAYPADPTAKPPFKCNDCNIEFVKPGVIPV